MANVVIPYRFRVKRDTAAAFTTANTLLLSGEFGLETDTRRMKIGDGVTAWNSLPYHSAATLADTRRILDLLGSTAEGDIIYKGASGWTRLAKGANDQVLKIVSGALSWAAESGGGGGGESTYTQPGFSNVATLLHFDGTNGSTTITDQVAGNTWTATNATISTAQSVFGGSSVLFTGASNSRITMPTNSKFNVTGDFVIEFRLYPNGAHQSNARIFQTRDGPVFAGINLQIFTGQQMSLYMSNNGTTWGVANNINVGTMTAGQWNSVLIQRRGGTLSAYINGMRTYGAAVSSASLYYNASDTVVVGGQSGTSQSLNAYMDEFRFTNGQGIVTEIPVPSSAFPDS